jgi:hypothetical protein
MKRINISLILVVQEMPSMEKMIRIEELKMNPNRRVFRCAEALPVFPGFPPPRAPAERRSVPSIEIASPSF